MSKDVHLAGERAAFLGSLLDDAGKAIVAADSDGRVIYWNKLADDLYQWDGTQDLGENLVELLIPASDFKQAQMILRTVAAGDRWQGLLLTRLRDGAALPLAAEAIPLRGEQENIIGVAIFISLPGSSEDDLRRLREGEQKYRSIFENAAVGIFQTALSGRFLAVNTAMAKMLGYDSPEDFQANVASSLDIYSEPEKFKDFLRIVEEHGSGGVFECQAYRKDRQRIWVQASARAVLGDDGRVAFYEGSIQDVTERRLLEDQLNQAQKMEAIGRLAGGVAHDFNNLLTAINGYGQLLLARLREDDPCHGYAKEIIRAGDRATALTNDLLTFSRKPARQTQVLNLNVVVADMGKMLSRMIGEDINFSTNLTSALGSVKADRGQIERVLMNLAVNARDAMPDGGCLVIGTENVRVKARPSPRHVGIAPGPYVLLSVADTGKGMDEETMAHVFEPFFTTKAKGKGTGLGLSTAYAIVRQNGGYLIADSQPGAGTTFRIYLPRVSGSTGPLHISDDDDQAPRGQETILLVEDEPTVRAYAAIVLREQGYTVLEAGDGEDALRIVEDREGRINLILTDVVMPKMGGKELFERVHSTWPSIRILFYSGYTSESLNGKIAGGQEDTFLHKPFTKVELARFVRLGLDAPSP